MTMMKNNYKCKYLKNYKYELVLQIIELKLTFRLERTNC